MKIKEEKEIYRDLVNDVPKMAKKLHDIMIDIQQVQAKLSLMGKIKDRIK